jgi:hypothetical protein
MTLREAIVLENSPAEIWAILADPALMKLIDTFGYAAEKSRLDGIRELVVEGARD